MDAKLRPGVIGIGDMGSAHCRNLLCGITGAELNVPVYTEGEALIASGLCDAVLVAVPHDQHPALTVSALRQG